MNDVDCWIYFDGPEPALIRPILDALRTLSPPPTPEDKERVARQFFEKLDASIARRKEAAGRKEGQEHAAPVALGALPARVFGGFAEGAEIVLIPALNLAEYASLCAELAVSPERTGEILRKYNVLDEASRRALDESWAERFAGNEEERTVFERAVEEFSAWLRTTRETRA